MKQCLVHAVHAGESCALSIDESMAALTKAIESVKTVNDKLYEIAYKDGNLEMKEIK